MVPDKNFVPKKPESQYTQYKNRQNKSNTLQNAAKKAEDAAKQMRSAANGENTGIKSDMLGSYTGMFYDGGEPDQDADDL